MIVGIIILSLIFISFAFILTVDNAKYLLSGYNTMSKEERKTVDIKSFISFFKKFHIFLGLSLFAIGSILFYFVNSDWSGIFMTIYPIMAYMIFILKANSFFKQNDGKQNRFTLIVIGFIFFIISAIVLMNYSNIKENPIEINLNAVNIKGNYGMTIPTSNIKSIELVKKLPEISIRTNGFALQTIRKGYFRTKNGENVKLIINSDKTPIILITTMDNQKIYYSAKNKLNQEIFEELQKVVKK